MRRRSTRLWAGVVVGALALVGLAAPAFAESVNIRTVDASAFPTVKVIGEVASTTPLQPNAVSISENGSPVKSPKLATIATAGTKVGVVLVLDTSVAMASGDRLKATKDAALRYVGDRRAKEQVAIVAAGSPARVLTGFTSDAAVLTKAINAMAPGGRVARWDAIQLANGLLSKRPELQPNIVAVAGGADNASAIEVESLLGNLTTTNTAVWTVGVGGAGTVDTGSLQAVAAGTGGQFIAAADGAGVVNAFATATHLVAAQFVITYTSAAKGALDISVAAGGAPSTASVPPGAVASGRALRPEAVKAPRSLPLIGDANGKYVATGLVVLAAALAAWGLLLLLLKDRADLSAALRPYSDDPDEEEDAHNEVVLAETGFVRRAVEHTGKFAQDRGVLEVIEQRLEQADLPLRAAEALFFWGATIAITGIIGMFLGGFMLAFVAVLLFGLAPFAVLNFLAGKRKRKFMAQLPDALQLLGGTLRSGYSLLQGVEAVSQEAPEPMGGELRRVMVEARLGRPLEESLQDAADRMGSADFDWAVMAVRIQREVGGNLAELLDTVGETMVQRERLRRDVRGLTAEGRMSAIVLALLPPGVGLMMYTLNPAYINTLFQDSLGKVLLVGATGLAIGGFLWMKKMIEIEA